MRFALPFFALLALAAPASAMGFGMDMPNLWWPDAFTGAPEAPASAPAPTSR